MARSFLTYFTILGVCFLLFLPKDMLATSADARPFMDCSLEGISNIDVVIPTVIECGSSVTVTFSADLSADVSDTVVLSIVLPAGFSYESNVTGSTELSASPISIEVVKNANSINFTFDLKGQCGVGDSDGIDFTLNYDYLGLPSMCVFTSDDVLTDDIAVIIAPNGTPGRNTEDRILAVLNEIDTLTKTIVQEGDGVIDTVFYAVKDHPLMTLVDVVVCATGQSLQQISTTGGYTYFGIGADGMMVDGNPGFERNEGIDICEIWQVNFCPTGPIPNTESIVSTSCDFDPSISTCQENSNSAFLDFEALLPLFSHDIDKTIPYDPICMATDPYELGYIFINVGGAPAGRFQANLTEYAGTTAFDLATLTYQVGSSGPLNTFVDDGPNTDASSLSSGAVSSCVHDKYTEVTSPDYVAGLSLYSRARLEFSNIYIQPGDTVFMKFTVYPIPCGCSSCDIPYRGGSDIDDIDVWTLCDDKAQYNLISQAVAWPNSNVDFSSFMEAPAITCSGDISTLSTTVGNYANTYINNQGFTNNDDVERNELYFNDEGICTGCYLEIVYEIPNGLDYVPGSVKWNDDDGTGWTPDIESFLDNNGGVDVVTLRWTGAPPAGWDAYAEASLVTIDYTTDCGVEVAFGPNCSPVIYDDEITKTVKWSQSGDCPECIETIECIETLAVSTKCPGTMGMCACNGFIQTLAIASRSNLYEPDGNNNGCYESTDTYVDSLIRTDRYLKGDSIEVELGGTLQLNTGSIASLDYIYAEVNMPNDEFIPLGGVVTIVSGGTTYTCDVLTQTIETGNILLTDLSLPRLMSNGCTMLPSTYNDGDSVHVKFYYTVNKEFTGEVDIQTFRTFVYASETERGTKLSCVLPLDYRLTQVGVQSDFNYSTSSAFVSFAGCETGFPYYQGYSRVGTAHVDYFPGEYVGYIERIPQFRVNIPEGMAFNYFRFYLRRKNTSSWSSVGTPIGAFPNSLVGSTSGFGSNGYIIQPDDPSITVVGDQIIFDVPTFMNNQFGDSELPCSDEGYSWSFRPYFIATCDLEAGPIDTFFMESDHLTSNKLFCSAGYFDEGSRQNVTYEGGAEIVITAVDDSVAVNSFPTCAVFRITNTGTEIANNVWMSLESASNDIIIQSVSEVVGNTTTPVTGSLLNMYELGNITPGFSSSSLFEVCAVINSCDADILDIFAGYDCLAYPTIREEAVCSSTDEIKFVPVEGSLAMSAKAPSEPIVIGLCDTIEHVVDINAAGPGYLSDVFVDIRLPLSTSFVPGSFEIAYPTTASPTTLAPDSEYEPAPDPRHLRGKWYRFDVDAADSILSVSGLIGSDGSAFNLNVVNIRYKVVTDCGYASGSRIRYRSNARSGCGAKLRPAKRDRSVRMNIFNAPDPFISEISLNADTLNACSSETAAIEIGYQINGMMETTNEDSIRVILPPGISLVPDSYRSGTNPLPDPPLLISQSGQEVLYWGISGLTPGEEVTFAFDITGVDIGQDCDNYEILVQTFKSATAYCSTTMMNCAIRSISNEASSDIFIIKPEISVTDASAVNGMIMGDEEMIDFSFTIKNDGEVETDASAPIVIDIYGDRDGDCRFTPEVDTLLRSLSASLALTPGESGTIEETVTIPIGFSCNIMAVLDNSKNCSCETTTSSCIRADLDLKLEKEVEVCSNEIASIGPIENAAYSYTWSALGGSDIGAISPTTGSPVNFQYDNNIGSNIVWDYGVRVDRDPGCYAFDTVEVTVFPETTGFLESNICAPIPGCGDPVTGFFLAGPIDGTDYNWSILSGDMSVGFVDNSDTLSDAEVDGLISESTTFLLEYKDPNGCDATFEQTVSLINCACTALGDTVWFDFNVDGVQDPMEPGIPSVTVFLYDANDLSTPLQSTITNADGYYKFQPLPSANYVVRFDKSTHTSPYHILEPTLQDVGSDDSDSDADPSTGFTGAYFIPNGISDTTVDAGFYPAFDLALIKEIDETLSPGPYFAGDTIDYKITVVNQGGYYGASDVDIIDYFDPSGLTYITGSNGAVLSSNGINTTIIENGGGTFTVDTLAPLDTILVRLQFQINAGFTGTNLVNYAEISDFSNQFDLPDSDSNADSVNSDSGGTPGSSEDNHIGDDGQDTNNDGIKDEDDHDPAQLTIGEVDLALAKRIDATYSMPPAEVGDLVKFDIVVLNQGDVPVENVVVEDYVPSGYTFSETQAENLTQGWDSNIQTTLTGILLPGERDTVSIYLTVVLSFDDTDYINASEIISAMDTTTGRDVSVFDIDSDPGSNTTQEQATTPGSAGDNNISSTGNTGPGSQDDHDVATIQVVYPQLSIEKTYRSTVPLGDNCYAVTYRVAVANSGLAPGEYDLSDMYDFDDDVTVNSISQTNTAVGYPNGPFTIINDQPIAGGKTDFFYITFDICIDLDPSSTDGGDNSYSGCGDGSGGGDPSTGDALFNTATLSDTPFGGLYDDVDTSCAELPYLIIDKITSSITEEPNGSFTVVYQIDVQNIGGDSTTYDLYDLPQGDDDITYNSASFTSNTANSGALAIPVSSYGWSLANDENIYAGATHSYSISINTDMDLRDGMGDNTYTACGSGLGGSSEAGNGLFNQALLDVTNDTIADQVADACQDLPFLVMTKSLSMVSVQQPDGSYNVTYDLVVENLGGATDDFDLYDLPSFDDDITIVSANYTSDHPSNPMGMLNLPVSAPGWLIADGDTIAGFDTYTYTVVVNVDLDLTDGGSTDDIYNACGENGGSGPIAGEGLFNEASLDSNEDGISEARDSACADLPFMEVVKVFDSLVETSLNCYDVYYTIVVENSGGEEGEYDLTDNPAYDDDFVISQLTYSSNAVGNSGGAPLPMSGIYELATNQMIAAGKIDTFSIIVSTCLDLTDGVGDNIYSSSCGSATGGMSPSSMEGMYNQANIDTNNDGMADDSGDACVDVPYLIIDKTLTKRELQMDGSYDVEYVITVSNLGGAVGEYDLYDFPEPDDDVVFNSASYTSNTANANPSLTPLIPILVSPGWVLADDESIIAGGVHNYELSVNVTLDISDPMTPGDGVYTTCGAGGGASLPGQGLYNQATLDVNNDGMPDDSSNVCLDLADIIMDKSILSISDQNLDGTYDVTYEIIVTNVGSASEDYSLFDQPQYDDDIVINSADYTSNVTGNLSGTIADPTVIPWVLGAAISLPGNAVHRYELNVNVSLDLTPGVSPGDDTYTSCGSNSGGIDGPNQGLYNIATLDEGADGSIEEMNDACGDLPFLVIEKNHISTVSAAIANCYTVNYNIVVENIGGATGTYNLSDMPGFDDDFTVLSVNYTSTATGLTPNSLSPISATHPLASDQSIIAGKSDVYVLVMEVCIDLEDTDSAGDEVYTSACGDVSGALDPSAGEGLYNAASLDTNDDGIADDTDEACDDVPYLIIRKSISEFEEQPNGSFNITYLVEVENIGQDTGSYDLTDTPQMDDDISIIAASFSSTTPNNNPALSTMVPANGWILANDQTIVASTIDSFWISTNVDIDLMDGVGDDVYTSCGNSGGVNPISGEGVFNMASIDVNNDGTKDSEAVACQDLPFLTMNKSISTISTQNPDGSYDVTYSIEVQNIGGIEDDYDLVDLPQFEDDITINSAAFSSSDIPLPSVSLLADPMTGWSLANGAIIAAGATHTYDVIVNVDIDLLDGVVGDDTYSSCGSGLGGAAPSPGEGLFNEAFLDASEDGVYEVVDTACGELPFLVLAKMHDTTLMTSLNCYDVTYTITVENIGGASTTYDLIDDPMFDTDFTISAATYNTDADGVFGTDISLPSGSSQYILGQNDQPIAAGKTDTYVVKVSTCLDLEESSSPGNEVYDASCGTASGGSDSSTGEGLHNEAFLDTNNDAVTDQTAEACDDVPYLLLEKEFISVTPTSTYDYDLTYRIVVRNIGGAVGLYDVTDIPQFDDDILINTASFTSNIGFGGLLSLPLTASGWDLVVDQPIGPSVQDTFLINLNVTYDFFDGMGDDTYTECGAALGVGSPQPGEGLYNQALLDVGSDDNDDLQVDVCGDIDAFDLALKKELITVGPYEYGDVITYRITVFNQGTVDATNIQLIDYAPCGLRFDQFLATNFTYDWSPAFAGYASTTVAQFTPLASGDSIFVDIALILEECPTGSNFVNIAEISRARDGNGAIANDIDSSPDISPIDDIGGTPNSPEDNHIDDDGMDLDMNGIIDEDDHDPAKIEIFDLALRKELATMPPYNYGDTMLFNVVVCNQGNIGAKNITVLDYIPTGYEFQEAYNTGWTVGPNGATYTIADTLASDSCLTIPLKLVLQRTSGGEKDWINYAEITSASNKDGEDRAAWDIDSNPNSNSSDETDVEPDDTNDDNIDSTDKGGEEDDHDPAGIEVYDLSQRKVAVSVGPYSYGDTVEYSIEVYNQGSVASSGIEIKDHLPCGLAYDSSNDALNWSLVGDTAITTLPGILPAGGSTSITIRAILQQCIDMDSGSFTNVAELTNSESEDPDEDPNDIDSNEDDDPDNDANEDDAIDDPADEDDHDEEVISIFDLALGKNLVSVGPYSYGDTLLFAHEVCNQGNVDAQSIEITDHLPTGFNYDATNIGWTLVNDSTYTYEVPGVLEADSCITVAPLRLILERTSGGEKDWMNYSELSVYDDDGDDMTPRPEDADSTPNSDSEEERDVEPGDAADGDLESTEKGDEEDDHDPAGIEVYDLAQRKVAVSVGPYSYGDTIEYSIEVYNQGSVASSGIEIKDHLPCGLAYDSSNDALNWSLVGDTAITTLPGILPAGGSTSITIRAILQQCIDMDSGSFTNIAELTNSESEDPDEDPNDIDSNEDDDPDNDANEDDALDDPADEDDHDEEVISIFDLALGKNLVSVGPYSYGDTLLFEHKVCNQGNVDAQSIEITDHLPPGFSYDATNIGWTLVDDSTYTYEVPGVLEADSCITVAPLRLILERTSGGEKDWMNYSELSDFDDTDPMTSGKPEDADSTPNSDSEEERDVEPGDASDGDLESTEKGGEEDDHDPAGIEVYDLAQRKVAVSVGPYSYGDTIEYSIEVYNQGSVASSGIEIKDHLPCGLAYDTSNDALNWSLVGDTAITTLPGILPAGGSTSITIRAILQQCIDMDSGSFTNIAELTNSESEDPDEDPNDIDSNEDDDPDNDANEDDALDDPADEDDHDEEVISIFDLALGKNLVSVGPYSYGDTLLFEHEVCNQGNVDAQSIEITDHLPSGFSYDATNIGWMLVDDSTYTYEVPGVLEADSCITVAPLRLILERTSGGEKDWMNYSELSDFDDTDPMTSGKPEDADSTPNSDSEEERDVEPGDAADGDLESTEKGGEEDDHDPAGIEVYDLSQRKVAVSVGPYSYGDTIEYSIEVYNQGSVASSGIEIKDHLPCGLAYDTSNDALNWSLVGDTAITTLPGVLPAGGSTSITIRAILQQCIDMDSGSFTNIAELTNSESEDPDEDPNDIDSNEDDDPDNDANEDDALDDPADEDDHDEEVISIFDLALGKNLVSVGPYSYGDTLLFEHEVCNQGNVDAQSIEITDHLPSGFSYDATNIGWMLVDDSTYTYEVPGVLEADSCITVAPLRLILERTSGGEKDWMNYSELSDFDDTDPMTSGKPEDADSTPNSDSEEERDVEPGDVADGDLESTEKGGEEDDHDPAGIEVYDLAQRKVAVSVGPYSYGDTIEYSIEVYNQGSVASSGIEIKDHLPCGLAYDSSNDALNWSLVGDTAITTLPGILPAGGSTSITIRAILQQCIDMDSGSFTNIAELTNSESEDPDEDPNDIDSNGDDDPDNDANEDDEIDDPADEDDHDREVISVFDLALSKNLVSEGPFMYGDTLMFEHEVCNQGYIDAQRIEIKDHLPPGFSYDATNIGWTLVNDSTYTFEVPGILEADNCITVAPLRLILERTNGGEKDWINYSELSDYDDDSNPNNDRPEDSDSTPDSDSDNERDVQPGDAGDGDLNSSDMGGDEDDHDPAGIEVVDFALIKQELTQGPFFPGDIVTYYITVYNQGSVAGKDITIFDYEPIGLDFFEDLTVNNGWSANRDDIVSYVITDVMAPGDSVVIPISLIANENGTMTSDFINIAEIGGIYDVNNNSIDDFEIDSKPDDMSQNDFGGESGGNTDNQINNEGGDEDDADPAEVCIVDYNCPDDITLQSCITQDSIDSEFTNWLSSFKAEGCGVEGTIVGQMPEAPLGCSGGSITVTFEVTLNGAIVKTCVSTYTVLGDDVAPTCPSNWNIRYEATSSSCIAPAYQSIVELESDTNGSVFDECTDDSNISLEWYDTLIPIECNTPGSDYFDSREVIRSYTFTDECGNTSSLCDQEILYEFEQCAVLTDFGTIGFGALNSIIAPANCAIPRIDVVQEEQGVCGYVEYMWLISTELDALGNPYLPTDDNIGSIWLIIPGEVGPTLAPGEISQSTFFVRCARNFSCCAYGESNVLAAYFNESADCSGFGGQTQQFYEHCDSTILLTSPTNDFIQGEQMMYLTDEQIHAQNLSSNKSSLTLDAGEAIIMNPGFEIRDSSLLQVYTNGCIDK